MKLPSALPRLLRTSAVRLALRSVLVYALVLGAALAALYWTSSRYVSPQLETQLEEESAALAQEFQAAGIAALSAAIAQGNARDRLYLLLAPDGSKLAGNLLAWPEDVEPEGKVTNAWLDEEILPRGLFDDDARLPLIATRLPDGSRLLVAASVEQAEALREIAEYLLEALPLAVVLALIMGVTMGRTMLARMDRIGRTAGEIAAGDLSQRVPVSVHNDEFDALANRLNAMLDRIQQLIRGMRDVTDNVAHDLRNPLTRLRNRFEITLLGPRSEEEYRQALSRGIEDADALIKTFNALLGIAQAEAGSRRTQWETVDLSALAHDLTELYGALAEEHDRTLDVSNGERTEVTGSRDLLAQAIGNLLDNAIKYSPENGTVRLRIRHVDGRAEISVSDNGPGIAPEDRQRVLERFVRLDNSRHTPGNGLGLALVQAVAKLHGAELILADANPGLIVTLRFEKHAATKT